jgi:hypothetical protein
MNWEVRTDPRDPNAHDVYEVGGAKVAHLPWCQPEKARLIAAAPDLLALTKAGLPLIEQVYLLLEAGGRNAETARAFAEKMRAAISRAEGR